MSAFAAGCVCGADLEAYARERRRMEAVPGGGGGGSRSIGLPSFDRWPLSVFETAYLVGTIFAVIYLSVLGIVLGLFGAMHGYYEGRKAWMIVTGALAVIALALELSRL